MARKKHFTLYDSKEKEFLTNGKGVFPEAISIQEYEVLNGEYSLTIEYPITNNSELIKEFNIIKFDNQLYRIRQIERDSKSNKLKIYAPHIFYDLEFFFIEDLRPTDLTLEEAFKWLKENFDTEIPFNFYSKTTEKATIYLQDKNLLTSLFEMIERWNNGVEIKRDNFNVYLEYNIDSLNHTLVAKGKNISGITINEQVDEVATRLLPVGYNGLRLPELYINVPVLSSNFPAYPITKKIKFENIISDVTLRERAQQVAEHMGKVRRSIKVNFVELSAVKQYEQFASLEKVNIGDNVMVKYNDFGIDEQMKVVSIKRDKLNNKALEVELDQPLDDVNGIINKIISLDKKVEQMTETAQNNNLMWNSSFERFDSATKEPLHWSGGRSVQFEKNQGNYCCLLEYSEVLETPEKDNQGNKPRPSIISWEGNQGQFSFSKKGGQCQLQLFNAETLEPIELYLPDLTLNTVFNMPKTSTWQLGTYMVKFKTDGIKTISVRFTNIDADGERVFIDTVQIEESRGSQINYTDGINSTPFDNYLSDMWLEVAETEYKPVLDIKFTKRYFRVPSITLTSELGAKLNYEISFTKEPDISKPTIEYYTEMRVVFAPDTPENIGLLNITIIARGV